MTLTPDSTPERGWFKSSRSSNNAACVEVQIRPGTVAVRDSKDPAGPRLAFDPGAWSAFLGSLNFDIDPDGER